MRVEKIKSSLPAWMNPAVASMVQENYSGGYKFSFSKGERKVLRRRVPIPVAEWAEKFRVLEMSSITGKWKNLFTPYLTGIMNAAGFPGVETVIICKSPQTGGSEAAHNIVGWCIDSNPGPVLYVFPDENTARENSQDRIIPMILASKRLRTYLTSSGYDVSSLRINLMHMPIYLGWSGSVSRLGNKPIRTLILDELDKYQNPKNEASSESLAEKRTTTWRDKRHIIKISTPTTPDGPIWRALTEEAGARFDYWVKCPDCGHFQLMKFENIAWQGKDSQQEPKSEDVLARKLAYYPCENCGVIWDDAKRNIAVRGGEWREQKSGLELSGHLCAYKPVKVGFHIPAWLSYFVSLSEIACAALKHKETGRLEDLKNLYNQYRAEPWKEEHIMRKEESVLTLCDERKPGVLPKADIACLLAGVDTQGTSERRGYFRYVIRAFAYGDMEESWLVQCGVAQSFGDLNNILWRSEFRDGAGHVYPVRNCMIDAMGRRTKEVYAWAIKNRGRVFPWQGVMKLNAPYTISPQEYFPDLMGRKIKIPGGLNLWRCDTTFFKSDLANKLAECDPVNFHLHENTNGMLNQYAKEMCAEIYNAERMRWENPQDRANHFWDCEVMVLALAYILNVRHWKKPEAKKRLPPRVGKAANVADMIARVKR